MLSLMSECCPNKQSDAARARAALGATELVSPRVESYLQVSECLTNKMELVSCATTTKETSGASRPLSSFLVGVT